MATYEKNRDLILLGAYQYGTDPKVDEAIDKNEEFGQDQNFHRATLRWARAIGLWMHSAVNAPEDWTEAAQRRRHERRAERRAAGRDVPQ